MVTTAMGMSPSEKVVRLLVSLTCGFLSLTLAPCLPRTPVRGTVAEQPLFGARSQSMQRSTVLHKLPRQPYPYEP